MYLDNPLSKTASCHLATRTNGPVESALIIDLRSHSHLSFTKAKAIDVMWQLLVGAGGRFLMGWISYIIFMDGLTRLMENTPISFNLHAALTFSRPSLLGI